MTAPYSSLTHPMEQLSALADAELEAGEVAPLCAALRNDPALRDSWYTFHLIGDVLLSHDLAPSATHDHAFMAALQARLAQEPVVLAPDAPAPSALPLSALPVATANASRSSWRWPTSLATAAMVAGVGAVVGLGAWKAIDAPSSPQSASWVTPGQLSNALGANPLAATWGPANSASANASVPVLIRDASLDRYLEAHKQFAGTSALGVPSGYLQNATARTSAR